MLNEDKIIDEYVLSEARGVSMFPYSSDIDRVYNYIKKEVLRRYNLNNPFDFLSNNISNNIDLVYEFSVPKEYVRCFDFIKELSLNIYATPSTGNMDDIGNGRLSCDGVIMLPNGKLSCGLIEIRCLYDYRDGSIFPRSLYNNLYHELNHLYSLWKQMKNGDGSLYNTSNFKSNAKVYKFGDIAFDNNEKQRYFFALTYRLFNFNELNAAVEGVYGDLKEFYNIDNAAKPSFQDIIKKTHAYKEYAYFRDNMDSFLNSLTEDELFSIKEFMIKNKLYFKQYNSNFKKFLRKKIVSCLRYYLDRICRVGSLYYSEMDDLFGYRKTYKVQ